MTDRPHGFLYRFLGGMAAAAAVLAACNGGAAKGDVIEIAADGSPGRRGDEGVATRAGMGLPSFLPDDSGLSAAAIATPEGQPPLPFTSCLKNAAAASGFHTVSDRPIIAFHETSDHVSKS